MKNSNKRKYIFYLLSVIAVGAVQLLDWYFGSEDPIWHVFFYIIVIPVISFIFTLSVREKCSLSAAEIIAEAVCYIFFNR